MAETYPDTNTDVKLLPIGQDIQPDSAEGLVQSLLPFSTTDDKKSRYLGYRASGFSIREALQLIEIHEKTLHRWRESDALFAENEQRLPELRKTLGVEYVHMEFLRNYRYILEKDYRVIKKSIEAEDTMTQADLTYLNKIRAQYTPAQLEVLQGLIGGKRGASQLDFTDLILTLSRVKETATLEIKNNGGQ